MEAEVKQINQQMKVLGDQKRTKMSEIIGLKRELVSLVLFNVNVCLYIIGATSSRTIKIQEKDHSQNNDTAYLCFIYSPILFNFHVFVILIYNNYNTMCC